MEKVTWLFVCFGQKLTFNILFFENLRFFYKFAIGHIIETPHGVMANECCKIFQ